MNVSILHCHIFTSQLNKTEKWKCDSESTQTGVSSDTRKCSISHYCHGDIPPQNVVSLCVRTL